VPVVKILFIGLDVAGGAAILLLTASIMAGATPGKARRMAGERKRRGHAVVSRVVGTIFATIAVVLGLLSLVGAIWSAKQVASFAADVVRTCSTTAAWELSLAFGVLGVTLILLSTKGAPKLRNWFGPRVVGRVLGGGVVAVMVALAFLALFIKHAVSRHPTTTVAVVPPNTGSNTPTTQPAEPASEEHSTPAVNRSTKVASTVQPNQAEPTVVYEPVASTANVSTPEGAPEAPSGPAASSEEAPPSESSSEESSTPTYNGPQPSSESSSASSSSAQATASASSSVSVSSDEVNVSTSTSSVSVSPGGVNVSTPGSSVSVSASGVSVSTASSSVSVESSSEA
jgi:hypothetical protein